MWRPDLDKFEPTQWQHVQVGDIVKAPNPTPGLLTSSHRNEQDTSMHSHLQAPESVRECWVCLQVLKGEVFPADLVLLQTSDRDEGVCMIQAGFTTCLME